MLVGAVLAKTVLKRLQSRSYAQKKKLSLSLEERHELYEEHELVWV